MPRRHWGYLGLVAFGSFTLILFHVTGNRHYTFNDDLQLKYIANRKSSSVKDFPLLESPKASANPSQTAPLILMWTTFWHVDMLKSQFLISKDRRCPFECRVSSDRTKFTEASAVIFHASETFSNDLPPRNERRTDQIFVLLDYESPQLALSFSPRLLEIDRHYFNASMSYRLHSEYHAPYDTLIPTINTTLKYTESEVEEAYSRKKTLAFVLISNCLSAHSARMEYIEELRKYMNITVAGKCFSASCDKKCERKLEQESFFVLAFENSVCNDYVTEKFWRMKRLIVPVVLKRSIVSMIAPDDTFVAADDFEHPRDLAKFLIETSANKERYMKSANKLSDGKRSRYFAWTRHYAKDSVADDVYGPFCQLCRDLHQPEMRRRRGLNDFHVWYDTRQQCFDQFGLSLFSPHRQRESKSNGTQLTPLL